MAWSFGDGFDLYASTADMINGYWDSGAGLPTFLIFIAGRFSGSQALRFNSANPTLVKSSGVNDVVHHFVVSFQQAAAISGTTLGFYLELFDGATGQCSVVFRSDGAILLTSGGPGGTVLATYTGAFPVTATWYAFEVEVVINNTTGSFTVRKNGNNVADFTATSLNTRGGTANNYANKIQLGQQTTLDQYVDDFFWQSGAATGAWLGDIRCYTRMPASDANAMFSKSPTSNTQTPFGIITTGAYTSAQSAYTPFVAAYDGAIGAATVSVNAGVTGHLKCSIFSDVSGVPGAVLGSATLLTNPITGNNALTFPTPVTVSKGVQYWIGFAPDVSTTFNVGTIGVGRWASAVGYSAFPTASPSTATTNPVCCSLTITLVSNYPLVNEPQQDGLTTYIFDSNPGDADFYGVGSIASTPATVIATTVRAYAQKSDAGTRTMAVQLKSGATTVASPTLVLTTSGFQWAWRTDLLDPNTGAAWTPAAVNNAQVGPKVIA